MKGFISEGANIILQRVMCQRQDVPGKALFLALDNSFCLTTMKYVSVKHYAQEVRIMAIIF